MNSHFFRIGKNSFVVQDLSIQAGDRYPISGLIINNLSQTVQVLMESGEVQNVYLAHIRCRLQLESGGRTEDMVKLKRRKSGQ